MPLRRYCPAIYRAARDGFRHVMNQYDGSDQSFRNQLALHYIEAIASVSLRSTDYREHREAMARILGANAAMSVLRCLAGRKQRP